MAVIETLVSLSETTGLTLTAVSRFITTPAHPAGAGPDFINAAAILQGWMTPEDVLARLHAIEAAIGRQRAGVGRWAARVIDLDLIASEGQVRPDDATQGRWRDLGDGDQQALSPDQLILPHPRLQDRRFVLAPLAEIAPHWRHPLTGASVTEMLATLGPGSA